MNRMKRNERMGIGKEVPRSSGGDQGAFADEKSTRC